jgi:hypothetical protein
MKQLKKTPRIFLVLTLVIFFSCNSDDDNNTNVSLTNAELIIGSWTWAAQSENGVDSGALTECQLLETFIYDGAQVEQIDYSGNPCVQTFTSTENYSIIGGNLTFSDINDPTDFYSEEIIELNATTLKLRYEETFNNQTSIYIDTYTKVN